MRMIFAFSVMTLAACNVDNDTKNDQLTVEYNQQRIESTAKDAARTAESVASSIGNVAEDTGRAISNEVGDVDVDVNVTRDRPGNSN